MMKIIPSFTKVSAVLLLFICSASRPPVSMTYQFDYENVLGTSFQLKVDATTEQAADDAEQTALKEIDRLNGILSSYDPTSEFSQWQKSQNREIRVSPELFEVLHLFDIWREKTSGALNASIGTASALWKKGEANHNLPTAEELLAATRAMKKPQWSLDPEAQTATHTGDQLLLLNTFVKSYIIRKVSDKVMSVPGVSGAVTNIGGDIVVAGNKIEKIRIADPKADAENDKALAVLNLKGRAIATSGNYRRGYRIGDQWFSHIIDARTAKPASLVISATVIAERATDAGALATAFNILEPGESEALAKTIAGVDYQIVTRDGREITSPGWEALQAAQQDKGTHMEEGNKLSLDLELAKFEGRFRRPFVAVWIENKKKEPVKTVALWYNKPRWLPDLKRWYTKNQSMIDDMTTVQSISSATRSAGKYTLTWDGLDDTGKAVPSGSYTLYIEAAREHGTYQLIKQDINWNSKPKHFDLKGGVEITSASIDIQQASN